MSNQPFLQRAMVYAVKTYPECCGEEMRFMQYVHGIKDNAELYACRQCGSRYVDENGETGLKEVQDA